MAEVMKLDTRDGLVTLINSTAASNIPAGTPVALLTGASTVWTLGASTTGFSSSALQGYHFVGITDTDYSAGDCPVTIFTEGVFKLNLSTGISATDVAMVGNAVYADSGTKVLLGQAITTGDVAIGSLVNGTPATSGWGALVKIKPAVWRHTISVITSVTATSHPVLSFPKNSN